MDVRNGLLGICGMVLTLVLFLLLCSVDGAA